MLPSKTQFKTESPSSNHLFLAAKKKKPKLESIGALDHNNLMDETLISKPDIGSGLGPSNSGSSVTESAKNSNSYPYPNFDGTGLSYYTEEQLKDLLLKRFEFMYNQAISKLVELGFDQELALKAMLRNGYIYGEKDVFTNIFSNTLGHLIFGCFDKNGKNSEESKLVFDDLRKLGEYSLDALVGVLQKIKPHLSKGNAMWSLLMSNFDVGRAILMEVPVLSSPRNVESLGNNPVENGGNSDFPLNKFSDVTLRTEIENPERFRLSPKMKCLLRANVAIFAAGFKAKLKNLGAQSHDEEIQNSDNKDGVDSVLGKFRDLNLDENFNVGEDQKDEMIFGLIDEIKDLKRQVKEKKEWAQEKAIQAAKKLSGDLLEVRILSMERAETERLIKCKHKLEETMTKRFSEMEYAMKRTSGEEEKANEAVRKLEAEKAEVKAEMRACKLSASEADSKCLQIKKREKKYLKRISGWEKQKAKMQEEIAAEKLKLSELKQELARIQEAQNEAEAKWRQEQKAKELAQAQVVEERRLKEETVINNKRNNEALLQNIEIEFKIHDDDLQRIKQELCQSKVTSQPTEVLYKSDNFSQPNIPEKEIVGDSVCMLCKKKTVSVVYMPCAHQVLCASCDDLYQKTVKAVCLHCWVPIEQRIRVLGVSS